MPESQTNTQLPTELLPTIQRAPQDYQISAIRVHELALLHWFNTNFLVSDGYPVPVIFATPMDAFAEFTKLWGSEKNPFAYLLELRDSAGNPIYEPYPANVRYPLISVKRSGISYRVTQSYGSRRFRRIAYPTVHGKAEGLTNNDLGNVLSTQMPTAWNYSWQINHYASRPDTQANFMQAVMRAFKGSAGGPETFIRVRYPSYYGDQICKLRMEGDIQDLTEPSEGGIAEYRTALTLTLEGYSPDLDLRLFPALWSVTETTRAVDWRTLQEFYQQTFTTDVRDGTNPNFSELENLPGTE